MLSMAFLVYKYDLNNVLSKVMEIFYQLVLSIRLAISRNLNGKVNIPVVSYNNIYLTLYNVTGQSRNDYYFSNGIAQSEC